MTYLNSLDEDLSRPSARIDS